VLIIEKSENIQSSEITDHTQIMVANPDGLPACKQSPIQLLTRPSVVQLCWSDTIL